MIVCATGVFLRFRRTTLTIMKLHPLLCLLIGAVASGASGASAAHSAIGGSHAQRLRDSTLTACYSATLRRRLLQADGTGDVNVTVSRQGLYHIGTVPASEKLGLIKIDFRERPPIHAAHQVVQHGHCTRSAVCPTAPSFTIPARLTSGFCTTSGTF